MRKNSIQRVFAVSIAFLAAPAIAEDNSILGTWSAETEIMLELNGDVIRAPREISITVESVDGNFVQGTRSWKALDQTPGDVAGDRVLTATEPFIGAKDTDGMTYRLVETGDSGFMFVEMLNADTLEFTYMENYPNPVIYTVVLQRQAQ